MGEEVGGLKGGVGEGSRRFVLGSERSCQLGKQFPVQLHSSSHCRCRWSSGLSQL